MEDRKRKSVIVELDATLLDGPETKKYKDMFNLDEVTVNHNKSSVCPPDTHPKSAGFDYDSISEEEEDTIFGIVKSDDDDFSLPPPLYRGGSHNLIHDLDHNEMFHTQFSCLLNEDGDMVLDQISATYNNNFERADYSVQPVIQEAPESPGSSSPQDSPQITVAAPLSNRKIPTSSWYSLIQDALDNMEGEATAREMVEYFEKNHKTHPFMKKTHWKQTVYTYLSKYFEKKFVGGSRDTIYTYTRTSDDTSTEQKVVAKKKGKKIKFKS